MIASFKVCNSCGEVKASAEFYLERPPGKSPYLRSSCKPCENQRVQAYRARKKAEGEWPRYAERKLGRRYNEIDIGPFREWLLDKLSVMSKAEIARRAKSEDRSVRRLANDPTVRWIKTETADRFFTALGQPDQMAVLYPIDH